MMTGLDARLTIPLSHERWPQRTSNAQADDATPLDSFGQDNLK